MMDEYPKLRQDLLFRHDLDGTLCLLDRRGGPALRLNPTAGLVLRALDGQTPPGQGSGLPDQTVYRYLCAFERHGLLEGPDPFLCAPGLLAWCRPCRLLRQTRGLLAARLYNSLIRLLWLPLLVAAATALARGTLYLPCRSAGSLGLTLSLFVLSLPFLVLHELAHAAAANANGVPVSGFGVGFSSYMPCAFTLIPLMPFAPRHVRRAVYQAGPLCNLCLGCGLLLCLEVPALCREWVYWAAFINLVLCVLNLLPLEGLDGRGILSTFPSLQRVLDGTRDRRLPPWTGFLERSAQRVFGSAVRLGLPALMVYDMLCLAALVWEVLRG